MASPSTMTGLEPGEEGLILEQHLKTAMFRAKAFAPSAFADLQTNAGKNHPVFMTHTDNFPENKKPWGMLCEVNVGIPSGSEKQMNSMYRDGGLHMLSATIRRDCRRLSG